MAELIDREELRERIYSRFGRHSTKVIATVEEGREMADWAFLEPFLNAAKVVDDEPIRHGRWVKCRPEAFDTEYACSICGHRTHEQQYQDQRDNRLDTFCGGCGARMDGDENGRTD